jgi:hypothetical protein
MRMMMSLTEIAANAVEVTLEQLGISSSLFNLF